MLILLGEPQCLMGKGGKVHSLEGCCEAKMPIISVEEWDESVSKKRCCRQHPQKIPPSNPQTCAVTLFGKRVLQIRLRDLEMIQEYLSRP